MSLDPTSGRHRCDKCGADVDNGSVQSCAIVTDLAEDGVTPVRRELCRTRPDPDNPKKKIKGCRDRVFTASAFRDLRDREKASR